MGLCCLSLHLGSSESRKTLEHKYIFQIGTLNPHGITFYSTTFLNRMREMVNFELGKDVGMFFFSSCRVRGTQKSIFLCIFTELKLLSKILLTLLILAVLRTRVIWTSWLTSLTVEFLWLSGRASERGIRFNSSWGLRIFSLSHAREKTGKKASFSNLFLFSRQHIPTNSATPFSKYKPIHYPQFLQSLWRRDNARNVSF